MCETVECCGRDFCNLRFVSFPSLPPSLPPSVPTQLLHHLLVGGHLRLDQLQLALQEEDAILLRFLCVSAAGLVLFLCKEQGKGN